MPTATPCTAYGFQVIAGALAPLGPRPLAWPSPPACNIDNNNGLKYDPVSGKMWVSPDVQTSIVTAQGSPYSLNPTFAGIKTIDDISLSHTSRICTGSYYMFQVSQGYGSYFLPPGNTWTLRRDIDIFINGTGVGFSHGDPIMACANGSASSGNLGQGGPIEPIVLVGELNSGETLKVNLSYTMDVSSLSGAAGYFNWRPPSVHSTLWSHS